MRRAASIIAAFVALAAAGAAFVPMPKPAPSPGPVSVPAAPALPAPSATSTPEWTAEGYRAARLAAEDVSDEISLFAVGDLMPGRGVERAKSRREAGWLLGGVAAAVRAADIAVANLEAPIVAGAQVPDDSLRLRADPGIEQEIADAGFDLLTLANNHALDAGPAGLRSTRALIEGQGMLHAGAGEDEAEARAPRTLVRNGLRVSFLSYADPAFTRAADRARPDRPGIAFMDAASVGADIASASGSDLVIVIMHAGIEYEDAPNTRQRDFARAAIDGGADLVIGHHPHVVQPAESYKGKPIIYSLGNFVFDQGWSQDASRGLAADIRLGKEGVRAIYWRPLAIAPSGRPEFAAGEAADAVIARVGPLAAETDAFVPSASGYAPAKIRSAAFARRPRGDISAVREADLDGDGIPERLRLERGNLVIERGGAVIWSSPEGWWIDDFAVGDLTRDGRPDLSFSVWKSGDYGTSRPFWVTEEDLDVRNHFFVYRLDDDGLMPVWQSSNLAAPNCAIAAADADGDGLQELIVAEGSYDERPDCRAQHLAVWSWGGWGFSNLWRQEIADFEGFDVLPGPSGALIAH